MKAITVLLFLLSFISVKADPYRITGQSGAEIVSPHKGSVLSGIASVKWTLPYIDKGATAYFDISNDGINYKSIGQDIRQTGMISFDTREFKDGVFYRIRASIFATVGFPLDVLYTDCFTINNPGNGAPEVMISKPDKYKTLSEKQEIKWIAGDAEQDSFDINIYYRSSYDSPWITVAEGIDQTDTSWQWNTENFANSDLGSLMVKVISKADTVLNGFSIVQPVSLRNIRSSYKSSDLITKREGLGTGAVWINKINPNELTGHDYIISFDSLNEKNKLVYNVTDAAENKTVLAGCTELDGITESPCFDGIRLILKNDNVKVIDSLSGLKPGKWYFNMSIRDNFDQQYSISLPFDYELEFKNSKSIYSFSENFPYDGPRVNFVARNITRRDTVPVLVYDHDNNGELSLGDEFSIVEFINQNQRKYNWTVSYNNYFDYIQFTEPDSGYKFYIKVTKPFVKGDLITFSTKKLTEVMQSNLSPEGYSLLQNYPNPFNPATTISYSIPKLSYVELKVYDILGREVAALINKEQSAGEYKVQFNASSLPSGIYIYNIHAGDYSASRKLVLLK